MRTASFTRRLAPLAFQCGLVLTGLGALALMPPEQGRLLLVPLAPLPPGTLIREALARDALLVDTGPWGAIIVEGHRDRLAAIGGAMLLAAPPGGCNGASAA